MDLFSYRRIVIIGTTASGKTRLAEALADSLGAPNINLDSLDRPGRGDRQTGAEAFTQLLEGLMRGERWIVDGGHKHAQEVVWPKADAIIWLDYPLVTVLMRLARRRWSRSWIHGEPLPVRGARQKRTVSGSSSRAANLLRLLYAAARKHSRNKREIPQALARLQIEPSKVIRLRSPGQTRRLLESLKNE